MTDDALIEELARAMCMSLKGPSWQSYIAAARFILPMIRHERNETQAAEIKTILDREADTHRRHDAKVDALEAEVERLRGLLLAQSSNAIAPDSLQGWIQQ